MAKVYAWVLMVKGQWLLLSDGGVWITKVRSTRSAKNEAPFRAFRVISRGW